MYYYRKIRGTENKKETVHTQINTKTSCVASYAYDNIHNAQSIEALVLNIKVRCFADPNFLQLSGVQSPDKQAPLGIMGAYLRATLKFLKHMGNMLPIGLREGVLKWAPIY